LRANEHAPPRVSSSPIEQRPSPAEVVAGYIAALAIFASAISIVWHPLRLVILSMLFSLIAAALGPRNTRIAAAAVAASALGFFFGMIVAIVFSKPLW
jgi:hypothetical protein